MTNQDCIKTFLQGRGWVKGAALQEIVHRETGATGETIARECRKLVTKEEIVKTKHDGLVVYQLAKRELRLI